MDCWILPTVVSRFSSSLNPKILEIRRSKFETNVLIVLVAANATVANESNFELSKVNYSIRHTKGNDSNNKQLS